MNQYLDGSNFDYPRDKALDADSEINIVENYKYLKGSMQVESEGNHFESNENAA